MHQSGRHVTPEQASSRDGVHAHRDQRLPFSLYRYRFTALYPYPDVSTGSGEKQNQGQCREKIKKPDVFYMPKHNSLGCHGILLYLPDRGSGKESLQGLLSDVKTVEAKSLGNYKHESYRQDKSKKLKHH
jgi:hypothetical protein